MNDFDKKIAEVVSNKLNDGTVEKLIEKKLEDAISSALNDVFSYGGNGKKLLEKKLNEVIVPVIEGHNFNQYLTKLDTVLTELIKETNVQDNKKILSNFIGLMKEDMPKEIKMSEIFETYCEYVAEDVDTSDLETYEDDGLYYEPVSASLEVEHEDDGWFKSRFDYCKIKLACKEDKELNCQIRLYKNKDEDSWEFFTATDPVDIKSLRYISDFDIFVLNLKRNDVSIIMDTECEYDDDIEPKEEPEY